MALRDATLQWDWEWEHLTIANNWAADDAFEQEAKAKDNLQRQDTGSQREPAAYSLLPVPCSLLPALAPCRLLQQNKQKYFKQRCRDKEEQAKQLAIHMGWW